MTALYNEPALHSRPVSYGMSDQSRRGSTSSLDSTDDDVITPCPLEKIDSCRMRTEHTQATSVPDQARPQTDRPKSWRDKGPHFNPLDSNSSDDTDRTLLWRTMLAIQRTFGCYNSARMRAALEMGDMAVPVPSKTCLDLLNDSIGQLPEEARRQLDEFLSAGSQSRRRSSSSWKHRLMHGPA